MQMCFVNPMYNFFVPIFLIGFGYAIHPHVEAFFLRVFGSTEDREESEPPQVNNVVRLVRPEQLKEPELYDWENDEDLCH